MANRTISLKTQTVSILGPTPSTKWNAFTWGLGSWGQKISGDTNSPKLFNQIQMRWSKVQSLTLTDVFFRPPIQVNWSGSSHFACSSRITTVKVYDGIYNEVFRDGVTNFISSVVAPTFTGQSITLPSYTTFIAGTPTYSAATASGAVSYTTLATSITTWS